MIAARTTKLPSDVDERAAARRRAAVLYPEAKSAMPASATIA